MLLIGVRRSGRRIMVQSIAGVTEVSKRLQQSDTFILAFNPRARHRQFFSQEFEQGFHYRGAFGIKNRIIIYGFNHHSVVLMELKLMQGDEDLDVGGREDRQLVPYLGPPIVVSQMVAVPSNIFIQEAFTDSERPSLLIGTHHYTYMSEGELLDVVSVPLASLMQGRHQGVEYRRYDGFLYFSNNGEFSVYPYESVRRHLGIFRVVTQIVDRERWNTSSLPPVNAILKGYTTRTWMNSYRFHRRMSYPHSIHRSVRHHIYAGWKRFVPALLGNLFIFLVLLQVVYQIIQVHEKLKYSLGMLSGSQSANSF